MNPVLSAAIGSLLRHVLTAAAGYLVAKGIWTPEEATAYVAAFVTFLLVLLWAVWQKTRAHELIVRALSLPSGSDLDDLHRSRR